MPPVNNRGEYRAAPPPAASHAAQRHGRLHLGHEGRVLDAVRRGTTETKIRLSQFAQRSSSLSAQFVQWKLKFK